MPKSASPRFKGDRGRGADVPLDAVARPPDYVKSPPFEFRGEIEAPKLPSEDMPQFKKDPGRVTPPGTLRIKDRSLETVMGRRVVRHSPPAFPRASDAPMVTAAQWFGGRKKPAPAAEKKAAPAKPGTAPATVGESRKDYMKRRLKEIEEGK